MDSILYIISDFKGYSICLYNKNKEVVFYNYHSFTKNSHNLKLEELKNSSLSLTHTLELIDRAKTNGINSFGIEYKGPLGCSNIINIELLNAHGIDIAYIKA